VEGGLVGLRIDLLAGFEVVRKVKSGTGARGDVDHCDLADPRRVGYLKRAVVSLSEDTFAPALMGRDA
jgi:hypothetical protein